MLKCNAVLVRQFGISMQRVNAVQCGIEVHLGNAVHLGNLVKSCNSIVW